MKFAASKATFLKTSPASQVPILTRQSSGFDQFYSALRGGDGLAVLDLAGASQANITFVTEAGNRISSDDIIAAMITGVRRQFCRKPAN